MEKWGRFNFYTSTIFHLSYSIHKPLIFGLLLNVNKNHHPTYYTEYWTISSRYMYDISTDLTI